MFTKDRLRTKERDVFVAKLKQIKEDATSNKQLEPMAQPQVTAPQPVIVDGPVNYTVSDETIAKMHGLIAYAKDVIPDYLEKAWAKAAREGDQQAMGEIILKVNPLIEGYIDRIKNVGLNDGKEEIWVNEVASGIVRRSILERWVITNQRAYVLHAGSDGILRQSANVGLPFANVVVMNQFRKSNSTHVGGFVSRKGIGVGSGSSNTTSRSYGDLVFITDGREMFRFPGISDPHGVKRMVDTLKKQIRV